MRTRTSAVCIQYILHLFAVTVISAVIMFFLFVSELNYYLTKDVQQELFVDTSRGQKLKINIDVTLMKVGCMCKQLCDTNCVLVLKLARYFEFYFYEVDRKSIITS